MPTPCLLVRPGMRMNCWVMAGSKSESGKPKAEVRFPLRLSALAASGSLQRRFGLFSLSIGLVGTSQRVEHDFRDSPAADFADLAPDAIDNHHIAAAQRDFPLVIEPVVERRAGRQFTAELRPVDCLAEQTQRHAAAHDKLMPRAIDVPRQAIELVLNVADKLL